MQGASPLASPGLDGTRHWLGGRWRYPAGGGLNPSGTCSPCPGGEDRLKRRRRVRRIVPSPPVPPLLGCRLCPKKGGSVCFAPKHKLPSALGTCLAGTISAAGGLMPGCRGRSPRQNKLLVPTIPPGRGAGGMGAGNKAKGRVCRRPNRQATLQAPQRQKTIDTSQEAGSKKPEPGTCADSGQQKMSREKFWGVWGTLSRVPRRFPHHRLCSNSHFA